MRNLLFTGIDVDDNAWNVTVVDAFTNEIKNFVCDPCIGALLPKLRNFNKDLSAFKICYEATHVGFSIARDLQAKNYSCEVIAPSLVPTKPGKKQKTNRIDSKKLADYYMKGMLTTVHIPTPKQEADRDLLRSRKFVVDHASALKKHITSLCRRLGWEYRREMNKKTHWTETHRKWLDQKIKESKHSSTKINLRNLLHQLNNTLETIEYYDAEITHLAEQKEYRKKAQALGCYRGIDTMTAMTIITELGDITRFDHPKRLTSLAGMDIIEYSTGKGEKKYRISKDGNKHLRTAAVETCQLALQKPVVSAALRRRRKGVDPNLIEIADRCMKRLHKKGTRLLYREKRIGKIKVACARELLCFVWESLMAVS